MSKKVILNLYKGNYSINFNDEDEYDIYLDQKNKYKNSVLASVLLCILMLASFLLIFVKSFFIFIFGISFLAFFISTYVYGIVDGRYNDYKYNLVLKDLQKNKYKIKYSNDKTGCITYIKDGVGTTIYVFRGKNAKSAK